VEAAWVITGADPGRFREPSALADSLPQLEQLVAAFGANGAARLIGVTPATVSNWRSRKREMAAAYARRIVDLHYVLTRALQTFRPSTASRWLVTKDPFLDEQRPIDVLVLQGPSRVIDALDAHEAGAYP
jgi:uncharacterized protein (DUF2384 family)